MNSNLNFYTTGEALTDFLDALFKEGKFSAFEKALLSGQIDETYVRMGFLGMLSLKGDSRDGSLEVEVVEPKLSAKVFSVTGSLKDWKDYLSHRDDNSFDKNTREAMTESWELLKEFYHV